MTSIDELDSRFSSHQKRCVKYLCDSQVKDRKTGDCGECWHVLVNKLSELKKLKLCKNDSFNDVICRLLRKNEIIVGDFE